MKALSAVLALALAMSVGADLRAAEEKADQQGVGGGERIQDLKLTDEQEAKIADIRKECRPKVQEAGKELAAVVKEEVEQLRGALTPEQRQKLQELKEERREGRLDGLCARIAHLRELDLTDGEMGKIAEIRKEYRPRIVKAMEGLKGILSEEQQKARQQALKAGKKRSEVLASLNLTEEQKEKVEAVCKDVATLVREEMERIRDVLTEEQKEKLQEIKEERRERVRDRLAHAIANFKDLNLTEEQKTKIADIRKEYRPKVQEAGNKLRNAVREELEMIVTAIKG